MQTTGTTAQLVPPDSVAALFEILQAVPAETSIGVICIWHWPAIHTEFTRTCIAGSDDWSATDTRRHLALAAIIVLSVLLLPLILAGASHPRHPTFEHLGLPLRGRRSLAVGCSFCGDDVTDDDLDHAR